MLVKYLLPAVTYQSKWSLSLLWQFVFWLYYRNCFSFYVCMIYCSNNGFYLQYVNLQCWIHTMYIVIKGYISKFYLYSSPFSSTCLRSTYMYVGLVCKVAAETCHVVVDVHLRKCYVHVHIYHDHPCRGAVPNRCACPCSNKQYTIPHVPAKWQIHTKCLKYQKTL